MDFIIGLPKVQGKYYIYVMVNKLTNVTYFYAILVTYITIQVADLFFMEMLRLYGMPNNIMSDRDNKFMNIFWKELFILSNIILTPITSYHSQIDGQTKFMNK